MTNTQCHMIVMWYLSIRLFTRLLLEAPLVTSHALMIVKSYCNDEVSMWVWLVKWVWSWWVWSTGEGVPGSEHLEGPCVEEASESRRVDGCHLKCDHFRIRTGTLNTARVCSFIIPSLSLPPSLSSPSLSPLSLRPECNLFILLRSSTPDLTWLPLLRLLII